MPRVKKTVTSSSSSNKYSSVAAEIRSRKPGLAKSADYENSRKAAIHLFCSECMGGSAAEASKCSTKACFLWPYRPGATKATKRPKGLIPTLAEYNSKLDSYEKRGPGRPPGSKYKSSDDIDDLLDLVEDL